MNAYRHVLFDLDGTLIDSIGLILDSYRHTLEAHGLPPHSEEAFRRGVGTPLRVQFAPWARDDAQMEAMIATYREYNLAHHDARVRAFPGVPETVRELRASGVGVAIVTSKNRQGALRGLRAAGLDRDVEVVVAVDDVARPKPDREPVDLALSRLGADPGTALFVGDSVHDLRSGRAAGVATGAAGWGTLDRAHLEAEEPTHWLRSPADLLGLGR